MEYSKKFMLPIFLCILLVNCTGCSSIAENIKRNQEEALDATIEKHDAIVVDIEQYVGKHKDELRILLGEPSEVISPSTWNNVEYDEEWVYEQKISFVNKQYRMFYFQKDIVAHVEFGGVY